MASTIDGRTQELFEAPNFVNVATLRQDGSVHTVIVWAHPEDGTVVLNTAEGRDWRRNVARDPRVTLTVINPENPYEWTSIRGRVVDDTHEGADEHIDMLAKKYLDQDSYPFRSPGEQRVRLVVEPEHVSYVKQG